MSNLPSYEIPAIQELAKYNSWVIWALWNEKKIPYTDYNKPADTTDPKTWGSFDSVCSTFVSTKVIRNPQGVGFVFSDADPFVGVDLDNCIDDDGKMKPWARKIVDALDSYTEQSPSRKGLHVIVRADVELTRNRVKVEDGGLEIYNKSRYYTVTGWQVDPYPETIEDRQDELLAVIKEHLPEDREPKKEAPSQRGEIDYKISVEAQPPEGKRVALIDNDKEFERTWQRKRSDLASQSEYEMSLMMFAVKAQWEPHECAALLIAHRRTHDRGKLDKALRYDYIDRTYKKARNAVAEGVDEKDASEFQAISESIEAGPEETLTMLSSRFGVEIEGAVRRGSEDTKYYLIVGGKEILLGGSEELFSLTKVRAKMFNVTGKPLKMFKMPLWMKITEGIFAISEFQEVEGNNRADELKTWVSDFISAKGLLESERWQDGVKNRMPFVRDGELYIHADRLRDWLRYTKDVRISVPDLRIRLREAGFDSKSMKTASRGIRTNYSFWRTGLDDFKLGGISEDEKTADDITPADFEESNENNAG